MACTCVHFLDVNYDLIICMVVNLFIRSYVAQVQLS